MEPEIKAFLNELNGERVMLGTPALCPQYGKHGDAEGGQWANILFNSEVFPFMYVIGRNLSPGHRTHDFIGTIAYMEAKYIFF